MSTLLRGLWPEPGGPARDNDPFADRAFTAIARAADSEGISVREAALIRAVLDTLDSAGEARAMAPTHAVSLSRWTNTSTGRHATRKRDAAAPLIGSSVTMTGDPSRSSTWADDVGHRELDDAVACGVLEFVRAMDTSSARNGFGNDESPGCVDGDPYGRDYDRRLTSTEYREHMRAGTVTIGDDLIVGCMGYGAMQLAGPKVWGEYRDREGGVALLREAVDAGVSFIDTADAYGPHSNEELIREALHPYPPDLVIATKGGLVRGGPELSEMGAVGNPHYLRQAAHMSARRLGLDRIDLYYLHTPKMTDAPFEEIIETLADMRQAGLIRHIGLSNVSAEQLRTAMSITDIAAVTAHYNVAVRLGAGLRLAAQDAGLVFSPWHPAGIPRGVEGRPFHAVIDPIAERHDATPQQIALAWQLHRTAKALPIPGTTSVEHLKENLAAAHISLSQEDVDAIIALAPEEHDPPR